LDDADAAVAYRPVASLVRTPHDAVALLSQRMPDRSGPGRFRAARADVVLRWIDTPVAAELRQRLEPTPGAGQQLGPKAARQSELGGGGDAKADADGQPHIGHPLVQDQQTFRRRRLARAGYGVPAD
jgi:hypothetical protein